MVCALHDDSWSPSKSQVTDDFARTTQANAFHEDQCAVRNSSCNGH